jgi:hypothetical protein
MGLKALLMQGRNDRLINRYKALTGHSPKPPPFGTTMGTTTRRISDFAWFSPAGVIGKQV